jgi:hypothetical protein
MIIRQRTKHLLKIYQVEKLLQRDLIKAINERYKKNVWIFKTNDLCRVGIPDLLLCFYGHFVAVELKRVQKFNINKDACRDKFNMGHEPEVRAILDKDVTPMQKHNISRINDAGGSAFVGRYVSAVLEKLDKIHESIGLIDGCRNR